MAKSEEHSSSSTSSSTAPPAAPSSQHQQPSVLKDLYVLINLVDLCKYVDICSLVCGQKQSELFKRVWFAISQTLYQMCYLPVIE